jgi:DNA-directed RNA polymerase I subunit RPA1
MDVTRAVSSKIGSTSFSFLTSAEIHAISVKQITTATLFDNTNLPTAGGLYDPALGPLGKADM